MVCYDSYYVLRFLVNGGRLLIFHSFSDLPRACFGGGGEVKLDIASISWMAGQLPLVLKLQLYNLYDLG